MYLRTVLSRPSKNSAARHKYFQLAHNEWDAEAGYARAKVLYNFGREDRLDREAIARVITALSGLLPADEALDASAAGTRLGSLYADRDEAADSQERVDPLSEAVAQWEGRYGEDVAILAVASAAISRVAQMLSAEADRLLKPLGLTSARYEVLQLLAFSHSHRLRLGKISQRLMLHPASITATVTRLEADGLVERVPDPSDGRTTLAQLTPAGETLAASATDALLAGGFGLLSRLRRGQLLNVIWLMQSIRDAAGDSGDSLPGDSR